MKKSCVMKKTLNEEKQKILKMMESLTGLSMLPGGSTYEVKKHMEAIRELCPDDEEFKRLVMDNMEAILSGEENELESPIDSDINSVEGEPSDDFMNEQKRAINEIAVDMPANVTATVIDFIESEDFIKKVANRSGLPERFFDSEYTLAPIKTRMKEILKYLKRTYSGGEKDNY